MIAILIRRTLQALFAALLISTISFFVMRGLPGDLSFRIAASRYGYDMVNNAAATAVRQELRLDRPAAEALVAWWGQLIRFDLGRSVLNGRPVIEQIQEPLWHTMRLSAVALLFSVLIGVPLGFLAGRRPHGPLDRVTLVASTMIRGTPLFLLGLLLMMAIMLLRVRIIPLAGFDEAGSILLPAVTLALALSAQASRVARNAMMGVGAMPFYAFARVKGLADRTVFLRHGLRNAAGPVVAYLAVQFAFLLEGVVVVETLFAWPGLGHELVHALFGRDIPMVQGTVLILALGLTALSALTDIALTAIDPRRRSA